MIVRINQLDPLRAEDESGWAARGMLGGIRHAWPSDAHAYEVFILDRDEQQQTLTESFRRQQLRQLIPEAITALQEPGEEVVVRLDGPLREDELLAGFGHLAEPSGVGRFAISEARKLDANAADVIGSLRIAAGPRRLASICMDASLGLDRSVRLRAFSVPAMLVNPLLDINGTDDERWAEILPQCGFVLSTSQGLKSFQVYSRRLQPAVMRMRLSQRLATQPRAES